MASLRRKKSRSDDEILKQALRQLRSAERHAEEINRRKDRAQKVYLGRTSAEYGKTRNVANPRDWRSRSFPAIAFEHAELAIAEISDSPPEFDAVPRHEDEHTFQDAARAAEDAVAYYLDRDNFPRTFRTVMRRAVKFGDCPIKIVWKREMCQEVQIVDKEVPVVDPETGEPVFDEWGEPLVQVEQVEELVEYPMVDQPTIIPLHYTDFLPDPTARNCSSASFVFHRWRATLDDLRALKDDDGEPFYKNLEKLQPKPTGSADTDEKHDNETQESFEARTTGVHTLHERWTPHGQLTIANRSVIIRHDEDRADPVFDHRKVPFEVIRLIEDEDSIGGVSKMLVIDEDQEMYWKFWNFLSDAVTLSVRPPKLVDEDEDTNSAAYDLYPDANIPARNGEQTVKVLDYAAQLSKFDVQQLLGMIRDNIERKTGMNANIAGTGSARSATEANSNLAQSKNRIRFEIEESDDGWSRAIEMFFQLIQQNADRAVLSRLTNGREVAFAPEDIRGQFMFKSRLSSERALKEQRLNSLQTIWESVAPIIQPGTVEIDPTNILEELFEVLGVGKPSLKVMSNIDAQMQQGMIDNTLQQDQAESQAMLDQEMMMNGAAQQYR